jgi:hypothetical protein
MVQKIHTLQLRWFEQKLGKREGVGVGHGRGREEVDSLRLVAIRWSNFSGLYETN